jgi:hypothetical protein
MIENEHTAHCFPSDPDKPERDIAIVGMIGHQCLSPEDVRDIKIFIQKNMEKFTDLIVERTDGAINYNKPKRVSDSL